MTYGYCKVTSDLDSYISDIEVYLLIESAIETIANQLLCDCEFNPIRSCNLSEAISEMSIENVEDISNLLKEEKIEEVGEYIKNMTFKYWYRAAKNEASRHIEKMIEQKKHASLYEEALYA